jgi:membrane protease YdiL (CAAX protease family)
MPNSLPLIAVLGFTSLCGVLAAAVVYLSPNPMPAGHAQFLAALIALFSAGGYALFRALGKHAPPTVRKSVKR